MTRPTPLLLLALLHCAPVTPGPEGVPPALPVGAQPAARRVVLMSLDGLGADALARQTGLAAFDRLAREGAVARVIPVTPTSTSPTHATILTGADPQRHGIVANRFHVRGTPPGQEARGMELDPDVETLVEAARRQGKRVGAVPFPSIDGTSTRRTSDFGLAWTEPVVAGRIITLSRADFRREWVPPTWTPRPQRRQSFSPVMRARLEWTVPDGPRIDIDLVAYDRTDDGKENYDAIFLESGDFEAAPDQAGWVPVSTRVRGVLHGSWSKILRADTALSEVAIYWGPIHRNRAWPDSFRSLIEEEVGFWPGEADPGMDPRTFTEQLSRLTEFLSRAQRLAIQRVPFDLLLVYQSTIDEAMHAHLGRNEPVVREAFVKADRSLAAVAELLDPSRDALVVTGDHGLMRRDREVRVNRLLADAGLGTEWRAFASGHVAHLYGRGDAGALVRMLEGSGYFERVETKGPASHPNSGDVVAYALPAYSLTSSSDPPAVADRSGGQHGALPTHRELHPVLLAIGPGIRPGPLEEMPQTRIARFVSRLLGIQPPANAQ